MTDAITFSLDGREVEARPGETIWHAAKRTFARRAQARHAETSPWR
jgi:hypothetical protein